VPRVFSQTVKERSKPLPETQSEASLGLSPENYSVLLVPVPAFDRQGTASLAAFPRVVKDFDRKRRRARFWGLSRMKVARLIRQLPSMALPSLEAAAEAQAAEIKG
jgi:hypothetical protein